MMHCEVVKDNEGKPFAIACFRGQRPRRLCKFCNREFVHKLCDFPTSPNKTCDAGICNKCSTVMGPDRDYCPDHKGKEPAAVQGSLFGGE